jgi:uncharacterized protein (TIGR03000 family)
MLIVPPNAEVWFDGAKTSQTGPEREFISPVLAPGKSYTYSVRVRSTSEDGRVSDETRDIHVRANDWWSVDFTRPARRQPPRMPGAGASSENVLPAPRKNSPAAPPNPQDNGP